MSSVQTRLPKIIGIVASRVFRRHLAIALLWCAVAVAVSMGAPAHAQGVVLSGKSWGAFAKLVGRDFVIDGPSAYHARFLALNAKTVVFETQSGDHFHRQGCYYLKSDRQVSWLPGALQKGDAYGCGSDSGEKNNLTVTDDGWSGEVKYTNSCGFMCGSTPAENRQTATMTPEQFIVVSIFHRYGEDSSGRTRRWVLIPIESMLTRRNEAGLDRVEGDPNQWGVFTKLAGTSFPDFDVLIGKTQGPMLIYDDRSPTFFVTNPHGELLRLEGYMPDAYKAIVTIATDGWAERTSDRTTTYTLQPDGSLLVHSSSSLIVDSILRPRGGGLRTMADIQADIQKDQRNKAIADQALREQDARDRAELAREEVSEALIQQQRTAAKMAAIESDLCHAGECLSRYQPGGDRYQPPGQAVGQAGSSTRWSVFCASIAGPGGRTSYFSRVFPRPNNWAPGAAAQVIAFRAYIDSRYAAHNPNVYCSAAETPAETVSGRDSAMSRERTIADVVLTDWQYGQDN